MAAVQPLLSAVDFQRQRLAPVRAGGAAAALVRQWPVGALGADEAGAATGRLLAAAHAGGGHAGMGHGGAPAALGSRPGTAPANVLLTDAAGRLIDAQQAALMLAPAAVATAAAEGLPRGLASGGGGGGGRPSGRAKNGTTVLSGTLLSPLGWPGDAGAGAGPSAAAGGAAALQQLTHRVLEALESFRLDTRRPGSAKEGAAAAGSASGTGLLAAPTAAGTLAFPPLGSSGGGSSGSGSGGGGGSTTRGALPPPAGSGRTATGVGVARSAAARVFRAPDAPAALAATASASAATRRRRQELCHPSARAGHAPPAAGDTAPTYRAYAARSLTAEPALADLGFIAVGQTYAFPLELRNHCPATRRYRLERAGLFDRPELATGTLLCRTKLLPLPAGLSCTALAYVCAETRGFLQGHVVFGADDGTVVEVPLRAVAVEPGRFAELREAVRRSGGFDALGQHLREESATARMVAQAQQRARSAGGGGGGSRCSSRGGVSSRGGLSLGSFASRPATSGGAVPASSLQQLQQLQQQQQGQQRAGTAGSRLASAGWLGLEGEGEGLGDGPFGDMGTYQEAVDAAAEGTAGSGGGDGDGAAGGGVAGDAEGGDAASAEAAAATDLGVRSGSGSGSGDSGSGSDGSGGASARRRSRPSIPRLRLSGPGIEATSDTGGDGSGEEEGEEEGEGGEGGGGHTAESGAAAAGGNSGDASSTAGWLQAQRTAGERAWRTVQGGSRSAAAAASGSRDGDGAAAAASGRGGAGLLHATTVRSIEGLGGNTLASVRLAGLQRTPQDVLARVAAQVREAEAVGIGEAGGVAGATLLAPSSGPSQLPQAAGAGVLPDTARTALLRTLIASQEARQVRRTRYVMDRDAAAAYVIPHGGTAPAAVPTVLRCVEEALAQPTLHSLYNGGGAAR
jgi:hypothetical protein